MTPVIEVIDLVREFNGRRLLNGISFKVFKKPPGIEAPLKLSGAWTVK